MVPSPVPRGRRGVVVPVAIIVLVVLGILGIWIMTAGTSEYAQSSMAFYGAKADLVARGIHEEAMAAVHDLYGLPLAVEGAVPVDARRQQREALLKAVKQAAGSSGGGGGAAGSGIVHRVDLLREANGALLKNSIQLAQTSEVGLVAVQVSFYGFRPLRHDPSVPWEDPTIYYRDGKPNEPTSGKLDNDDKIKKMVPVDYQGYYHLMIRTTATPKRGGFIGIKPIRKQHEYDHDIKLVNVAPIGREFALCSYGTSDPKVVQGMPEDYHKLGGKDDKSGGLKVYGYRWGRVLVRGPLLIELEGYDLGGGGRTPWSLKGTGGLPIAANAYPYTGGSDGAGTRKWWWGWALTPPMRAATLHNSMSVLIGRDPARPAAAPYGMVGSSLSRTVQTGTGVSLITDTLEFATDSYNPASDIKEGTQWLCESVPADPDNKSFSVMGDPVEGLGGGPSDAKSDRNRFVMFRGVKGKYVSKPAGNGTSVPVFEAIGPYWTPTAAWDKVEDASDDATKAEDGIMAINPEGGLAVHYAVASIAPRGGWSGFWRRGVTLGMGSPYQVDVKRHENFIAPYGLRWEHAHIEKFLEGLLRSLGQVAYVLAIASGLAAAGILTVMTGGLATPVAFAALTAGWVGLSLASEYVGGGVDVVSTTKIDANQIKGVFPSGFRLPLLRNAFRHYSSLDAVLAGLPRAQDPLVLDGVIWVNDLSTSKPFTYVGRGMIVSEGKGGSGGGGQNDDSPKMTCPIVPLGLGNADKNGRLEAVMNDEKNHLTIALTKWEPPSTYKANRQIIFTASDDFSPVVANVVSEQGVRPDDGKKIDIVGNLVCNLLNKKKIPEKSRLYVRYPWKKFYPESATVQQGPSEGQPVVPPDPSFTESSDWYAVGCSRKLAGFREGITGDGAQP